MDDFNHTILPYFIYLSVTGSMQETEPCKIARSLFFPIISMRIQSSISATYDIHKIPITQIYLILILRPKFCQTANQFHLLIANYLILLHSVTCLLLILEIVSCRDHKTSRIHHWNTFGDMGIIPVEANMPPRTYMLVAKLDHNLNAKMFVIAK